MSGDNVYTKENKNKYGKVISYRLIASGIDCLTGKQKNYTKTWRIPLALTTQREIKKELLKIQAEFEEEVYKKSQGLFTDEKYIKFGDFAEEWLENILIKSPKSISYYARSRDDLKIIMPFFKDCLLKNITPKMVNDFYTYICCRKLKKQVIVVKKSINEEIKKAETSKADMAKLLDMNRATIKQASIIGNHIAYNTAKEVCKLLSLDFNTYFDKIEEESFYAKETNKSIKKTFVMILEHALELELITRNVAKIKFTITGTEKEKEVYTIGECNQYIQSLQNEINMPKRIACALFVFTGMRRGEVCGLKWSDIDLVNKEIHVNRSIVYSAGLGVVEKNPKTDKSKRIIPISEELQQMLIDYYNWNKTKLNEVGVDIIPDYVCSTLDGAPYHPCTLSSWVRDYEATSCLKVIGTHSLRHTTASIMTKSGISSKVIQKILGHASDKTTNDIYTHLYSDQIKDAMKIYSSNLTQCAENA